MIFLTEYLWFNTENRREIVPITREVEQILQASGISEGFVLVSAMHITSGIIVNDDEHGLHQDIWEWLEGLAPAKPGYRHHRTGEDNAGTPQKDPCTSPGNDTSHERQAGPGALGADLLPGGGRPAKEARCR
jgi:thiamine phosphate synthase YjbQ (UPF0047 family)